MEWVRVTNFPLHHFEDASLSEVVSDLYEAAVGSVSHSLEMAICEDGCITAKFSDAAEAHSFASESGTVDVMGHIIEMELQEGSLYPLGDAGFQAAVEEESTDRSADTIEQPQHNEASTSNSSGVAATPLEEQVRLMGYCLSAAPPAFETETLANAKEGPRAKGKAQVDWKDCETRQFMQELLHRRVQHQSSNRLSVKGFWTDISNALWLKSINYSTEQCQKKGTGMTTWFGRIHNSSKIIQWAYYIPYCLLRNCTPRTSEERAPLSDISNSSGSRFPQGIPAIKLLIAEYAQRRDRFEKPRGQMDMPDSLYGEIHQVMQRHGYNVTPEACKKQWETLRSQYHCAHDNVSRSGAGATNFRYFSEMQEVLSNSVTVEPPVSISVGAASRMRRASCSEAGSPSPTPTRKRVCRSRTSSTSSTPENIDLASDGLPVHMTLREMQRQQLVNQRKMLDNWNVMSAHLGKHTQTFAEFFNLWKASRK